MLGRRDFKGVIVMRAGNGNESLRLLRLREKSPSQLEGNDLVLHGVKEEHGAAYPAQSPPRIVAIAQQKSGGEERVVMSSDPRQ
jgi:hypothetical protein